MSFRSRLPVRVNVDLRPSPVDSCRAEARRHLLASYCVFLKQVRRPYMHPFANKVAPAPPKDGASPFMRTVEPEVVTVLESIEGYSRVAEFRRGLHRIAKRLPQAPPVLDTIVKAQDFLIAKRDRRSGPSAADIKCLQNRRSI
ncbi:unnamed protein product (mitochondrion) [Plasmodiophora brassicae]|uniref:Uncharacterized protein n=1 Tax=Plasmodiophora brassicae TaxID=37360 RepID=A0A0G4IHI2_PLABS|nr:hypothetical protein PBRA_000320 [Plasmodiophora brassicae]SPQ96882.1 unnamed protein product [Plasmodiophora brassicae]